MVKGYLYPNPGIFKSRDIKFDSQTFHSPPYRRSQQLLPGGENFPTLYLGLLKISHIGKKKRKKKK